MAHKPYAPIPMVPGPVTLHPAVLAAMTRDYGSGQIEPDYLKLYAETGRNLAQLMGTQHDVVLMTGEGMLALWAALKSCLVPGDKVLSVGTGVFGDGIGDMAASIGCEVLKVSLPYNETIDDLTGIEDAIRSFKPKMLTAVHCETPSGTLNPLGDLGALKQTCGVPLFYVDAVASVGGAPVQADAWHADLVLGGSQKCLSAPPSMSFLSVSPAAWEVVETVGYQGYDAIGPFRTVQQDGRCPYTPYWHGTAALNAGALAILNEAGGMQGCFDRHQEVAERCRAGLAKLGIDLWTAEGAVNSPTVTAALVPEGFDWPEWRQRLRERGLIVSGSFGPMAGKVFRLGHMGTQATEALVDAALDVIETVMQD
ncbi:aminotransferase class V-fold PLP-dependent enzyme [Nitratidesulfovibrio sp.]|uniref:pyridoxal-phosphate-dependent aminotransferase family protein n=1 Tax=Nitratidesulfovibrio sp. TaxID=2802297 RepID=UPI00333F7773